MQINTTHTSQLAHQAPKVAESIGALAKLVVVSSLAGLISATNAQSDMLSGNDSEIDLNDLQNRKMLSEDGERMPPGLLVAIALGGAAVGVAAVFVFLTCVCE